MPDPLAVSETREHYIELQQDYLVAKDQLHQAQTRYMAAADRLSDALKVLLEVQDRQKQSRKRLQGDRRSSER
jgi:septation ring formation regulator EzrA